jgi:hypothetical protein
MLFDGLFREGRPGRIPQPSKRGRQAKRNNKADGNPGVESRMRDLLFGFL